MPLLTVTTNQQLPEGKAGLVLPQLSRAVADMLGKPEGYVMVALQNNPNMSFAGDTAPLAYLELKSIGLSESVTAGVSEALCQLVARETGTDTARIYIEFSNAPRRMWGWNNGTF